LFAFVVLAVGVPAFAQNPLVGTWESVSNTSDGRPVPPPQLSDGIKAGVRHWIYSPDGFYMTLVVPKDRPRTTTTPDQFSKEDWQKMFEGVAATYGIYSVAEDKLTRKSLISSQVAQNPGGDAVWTIRKDGEEIVLSIIRVPGGPKTEERIRRVKWSHPCQKNVKSACALRFGKSIRWFSECDRFNHGPTEFASTRGGGDNPSPLPISDWP
jgi:hypothetical protein